MFLYYRTSILAFFILTITGCINTAHQEEQTEKIIHLESALSTSKSLTKVTKTQLNTSQNKLKNSQQKIKELTTSLNKTQSELASNLESSINLEDKAVIGETEWVYISKVKHNFQARIDTGATTSSINAVDIQRFERDGEKWIRFSTFHEEGQPDELIEAKITRTVKIKQSSLVDEVVERPVIELHIRIGDIAHLTEFSLTDRQQMEFPVLIGRNFLRDVILVDVSKEFSLPKYQESNNKK